MNENRKKQRAFGRELAKRRAKWPDLLLVADANDGEVTFHARPPQLPRPADGHVWMNDPKHGTHQFNAAGALRLLGMR